MFFILSKLLYFLVTPIVWFFAAIAWAYFTKSKRRRKRILIITGISFYLLCNSFIVNEVLRAWEIDYTHQDSISTTYDYGIVLGGFNSYDAEYDRIIFGGSSDRLWQVLLLYNTGVIKKIVISGGEGRIIKEGYTESETTRDFLIQIGIPESDIIIEATSRNTRENAIYTAELIEDNSRCLLITSAGHMRRAQGCFTKAQLHCDAFSTDRRSGRRKFVFDTLFIPELAALETWRVLIREIIGYSFYKVFGYL